MADSQDGTVMTPKYGRVKNVVVDEAQNFKDRDGDWYSLLEKLSQQNLPDTKCTTAGYFWLFMDYAQKVHKFEAGLPGLIGKNNFMLREISRNSKEIYEYATKFMEDSSDSPSKNGVAVSPQLGHEFISGNDVSVVKCEKSSMQDMLYKVLKQFTDQGIDLSNMAILVSKKSEADKVMQSVSESCMLGSVPNLGAPSTDGSPGSLPQGGGSVQSRLTVSTVREFSGLDKPVVIGLDPHTNEDHADLNKFLLNLVTRAKDSLVILTTSDQVLEKLKA